MPFTLSWPEIVLRLGLTVLAGLVLGFNRSERGRPAGLRTTLLVCLAASVSMLQMNLLLNTTGKAGDSFVVMDVARLPLGILTGMGFIGGGVILRRRNTVIGVTTAATLWMATVLGLCFGGGQLGIGLAGLGLAASALWILRWLEYRMKEDQRATLLLSAISDASLDDEVRGRLRAGGYSVISEGVTYQKAATPPRRTLRWEIHWRDTADRDRSPGFLPELARHPAVLALQWKK